MTEYTSCEHYGETTCCGKHIDAYISHVEGFKVRLTYNNGQNISIAPWQITEVVENDNSWTAMRQNTPEYLAINTIDLTQLSRLMYARHHHWGSMTFYKVKICPFKR